MPSGEILAMNYGSLNKFISITIYPFGKGMLPENHETLRVEKFQIPNNPQILNPQ